MTHARFPFFCVTKMDAPSPPNYSNNNDFELLRAVEKINDDE
jgi:hypothetical protein